MAVFAVTNMLRAIDTFREHEGVLRTKDAVASGVHYRTLYEMRDRGLLERISRGRYRLAELPPLSNPDLAVVALRVSRGVICLISALAFHELTKQVPHEVYIALRRGSETPRLDTPPIRVFKFSGQAFTEGIEDYRIDGITVHRRSAGFDVSELMAFARICRVDKVMRPYVEAVL